MYVVTEVRCENQFASFQLLIAVWIGFVQCLDLGQSCAVAYEKHTSVESTEMIPRRRKKQQRRYIELSGRRAEEKKALQGETDYLNILSIARSIMQIVRVKSREWWRKQLIWKDTRTTLCCWDHVLSCSLNTVDILTPLHGNINRGWRLDEALHPENPRVSFHLPRWVPQEILTSRLSEVIVLVGETPLKLMAKLGGKEKNALIIDIYESPKWLSLMNSVWPTAPQENIRRTMYSSVSLG